MSLLATFLLYLWATMSSFLPYLQSLASSIFGAGSSPASAASDGSTSQQESAPGSTTSLKSSDGASSPNQPSSYEPTAMDVVVVKAMLLQGLQLPLEVILSIIDAAEYWPHTTVSTAAFGARFVVRSGRQTENAFLLRSRPLGLIRRVHYNDALYSLTSTRPEPFSDDDAEVPLSQFQTWIGNPTNTIEHPCRKIVFTITSHDQGWGGTPQRGKPYDGSWTWFEAGLERFDKNATRPEDSRERDAAAAAAEAIAAATCESSDAEASPNFDDDVSVVSSQSTRIDNLPSPYLPAYSLRPVQPELEAEGNAFHHPLHPRPDYTIQRNKTAQRKSTTHRVVWSWDDDASNRLTAEELNNIGRGQQTGDGKFVRGLKLGDVVTVWAKSRFGGWANHVESVKIDIYWAL